MKIHKVACIAVAIALAGCGPKAAVKSAPSASPTASPQAVKYYTSLQLLQQLGAKDGFLCEGYQPIPNPLNDAIDMAGCKDYHLIISIYANEEDTQNAPTNLYTVGNGTQPVYMVIGPNWSVNCDLESDCAEVQRAIQGEYVKLTVG